MYPNQSQVFLVLIHPQIFYDNSLMDHVIVLFYRKILPYVLPAHTIFQHQLFRQNYPFVFYIFDEPVLIYHLHQKSNHVPNLCHLGQKLKYNIHCPYRLVKHLYPKTQKKKNAFYPNMLVILVLFLSRLFHQDMV